LKTAVSAAVNKLAEQPSYSWQTTVTAEGLGPLGDRGGPTTGQSEKDGYTRVVLPNLEFLTKAGKAAVLIEDNWQTLDQAAARSGGGLGSGGPPAFNPRLVTDFRMPAAAAAEYLGKALDFASDGDRVTATLSGDVVQDLLSRAGPGRGGRRGGGPAGGTWRDPKGSVTFTIKDGLLTRFTLALIATREFRGEATKVMRSTTTTITALGSTKVAVAADAKEIVDALLAGTTPKVFVPEPGFKKLFNGRDLTGWAGRPQHWSVEDGAIIGRTTPENPAKGNNFLIAKNGARNLIVDDFELRFSFRVSGSGNSGVQYRSQERPNFVVAGYQADFDGGHRYSGILYDEAGGAGGRGIMAQRGEKVLWTAAGKKEITGQLGKSEEIRAAIKKDDWNEYVVIARGNHLQHFINGVQTVDVFDDTEAKRLTSGVLALQLHAGPPMTVQFRHIRIKSLSSAAATAAGNVKVAKDFKLELLYMVPKETQGSWVALCVDPKGRLIVSDQYGKLYRLTPPPVGRSGRIEPEPIDLDIGGAHGLLYAFDSLYVMVTERTPRGLYRLRDTDSDDRFDEVQLLRAIEGSGEHGVHSLVLAPDGKSIYVVCGNSTRLTAIDSSLVPLHWSEDNLLTRLPTGFMDNSLAPQGWVARTDPDGKKWELVAAGFRNQFDVAFNRQGELFTYDADMEWDIGDPWYRPTRVNHIISGAEFGFRNGSGKWPPYTIDSFGAVVNIGPGSPTGVAFGTGARFPAKYQDAFYVCDWSFGKLYAIHLAPVGASYTGQAEEFVTGQPLPLTDLVIHPTDGAMYFVVGGRRTQSALYRVTYVGNESTAPSAGDGRFAEQREVRRGLERFHGHSDDKAVAKVWPYLGDADRALRYAARVALEWQEPAHWRERALGESDARRAIAALVALARVSGKDELHRQATDPKPDPALQAQLLAALGRVDWSKLSHQDRLDWLRAHALVFTRLGPPDEALRQRLSARFDPLFPTSSRELNAELCQLLAYLQAPSAARKTMALLRAAPTQEEQIDYVLALRALKTGWTRPLREEYFRWFVTTAFSFRGGNTFASSLRRIRSDAVATLSDDEKAALKPLLEAAPEPKSPQELLAARTFVRAWPVNQLVPLVEGGLAGGRNFERGRKLYSSVACAACHRFGSEGGSVGPDLTGIAGRFSIRDLLEATIEPSKVISDQYAAIVIFRKNGDVVTGRVGNLSGDGLNVIEDMFAPGRLTNVRRQDIETMEPSKVSMMPEGLLNTLTEEEIQDLVAFLFSAGDPNHKMFR
jgi:putative heme-binding domain-containing protein